MAQLSDDNGYVEEFVSSDMITFVEGISALVPRVLDPVTAVQIRVLIDDLFTDLLALAYKVSKGADENMRRILEEKRKRPKQSSSEDLADHIHSQPFPGLGKLGAVGIVKRDEISKVPYWRVIEEGSAEAYPEFLGRRLYGAFFDGASPQRPVAEYAGADDPPHAAFQPGGTPKGVGIVQHEIERKRYIETGAAEAWRLYEHGIRRLSTQYAHRLTRIEGQRIRRLAGRL